MRQKIHRVILTDSDLTALYRLVSAAPSPRVNVSMVVLGIGWRLRRSRGSGAAV